MLIRLLSCHVKMTSRLTPRTIAIFIVVVVGLTFSPEVRAPAAPQDAIYAGPGMLVAVKGAKLNLTCMGHGSPTVIFESGWGDWAPAWSVVQPKVAGWTRACSYDRAGEGFSEGGARPRSAVAMAGELDRALHRAGIAGPYILVANGFGSFPARTFALRYTSDVAGLVLIDGDAEDGESPATAEIDRKRDAAAIVTLRACEAAIVERKPLPMFASSQGHPPDSCERVFFRGLPEKTFSRELNAKLIAITRGNSRLYAALISEMEEMPADIAWLRAHQHALGSRPVRVLVTGQHGIGRAGGRPNLTSAQKVYEADVTKAQLRWLALSSNERQIRVAGSGMYVELDKPDIAMAAIREVYDESRRRHE